MNFNNPTTSLEWTVFIAKKYANLFIDGMWTTIYIAVVGTIIGFVLGFVAGLIQDATINKGDNIIKKIIMRILKIVFTIYVEIFRDTPMIVQAMVVYFGIKNITWNNDGAYRGWYLSYIIKYRCLYG